jgi:FkbM family methyltransferase
MVLRLLQRFYHSVCPRWVVTRTLSGLRCRVNINDHLQWIVLPEDRTLEGPTYRIMTERWGNVWDVGANFGFFSMAAARAGNRVTAFDLSEKALELLGASAALNQLQVTTVARPLTLRPEKYSPPEDSSCQNKLSIGVGTRETIGYREAAQTHGTPNLIKMDIEGGEESFLASEEFLRWLQSEKISILVEIHGAHPALDRFGWTRTTMIDNNHLFIDAR